MVKRSPFRIGSGVGLSLELPYEGVAQHHLDIRVDRSGAVSCRPLHRFQLNGDWRDSACPLDDGDRLQLGEVTLVLQAHSTRGKKNNLEMNSSPKVSPPSPPLPSPPSAAAKPTIGLRRKDQDRSIKQLTLPLSKGIDLQRRLHRQLLDNLDLKKMGLGSQSEAQVRQQTEEVLRGLVSDIGPEERQGLSMAKLMDDVINQALGLGPLEDLLKDEEVTEIMVNGHEKVYVERGGRLERAPVQFLDDAQVVEVIRRIVAPIGRRIDESQPMVDGRLSDGSRVNAIIAPLAISGPSITIRKFSQDPFSVQDLIGFGSLTANMASFLGICVRHRKNICISGGTGSGKTTLLGVVASSIPEGERIVTIEDAAELRLPQDHLVSLESKPPNLEGEGAIPIRKLVINALRMRPDRIIVGECRGAEALDMLQAMNTGHDGSLTTLHANTCRDAISRMETMVLMAGTNLPAKAIVQQIAAAVDVIVQTNRFPDGSRRITSISVVDGIEGDKVTLQEVFAFEMKGYDRDGKVLGHYLADGGIPAFYLELKERGIDVDMGIFR